MSGSSNSLRRKGPKNLPKLPMSAFSPPNSGVSENFPLPPSPSTVHPERVVDASVRTLGEWKDQITGALAGRAKEVVVLAPGGSLDGLAEQAAASGVTILSAQIPFALTDSAAPTLPADAPFPVSLTTSFTGASSDAAATTLETVIRAGHVLDIDVGNDAGAAWDSFEDALTKATANAAVEGAIVLNNLLPPPHDLSLPIVQLLTHHSYLSYQAHIATLSLFPNTFVKYLPPDWNAPTPRTSTEEPGEDKAKKEWKRRIKMYLGPAVEAFGFERIIFGSAPTRDGGASTSAGDWYEIARESLTELGVDQDAVDAIFGGNARRVYGAKTTKTE